jgi:hypothetical protein
MFFNLFSHFKLKSGGGELMSLKALAWFQLSFCILPNSILLWF